MMYKDSLIILLQKEILRFYGILGDAFNTSRIYSRKFPHILRSTAFYRFPSVHDFLSVPETLTPWRILLPCIHVPSGSHSVSVLSVLQIPGILPNRLHTPLSPPAYILYIHLGILTHCILGTPLPAALCTLQSVHSRILDKRLRPGTRKPDLFSSCSRLSLVAYLDGLYHRDYLRPVYRRSNLRMGIFCSTSSDNSGTRILRSLEISFVLILSILQKISGLLFFFS